MKYCSKCGAQCEDDARFCNSCGTSFEGDAQNATGNVYSNVPVKNVNIQSRSIGLCIVLSIITCGIYGLYWLAKINDELNELTNEQNPTSGALVVVLSIITCNIYGLYWMYKAGEKCDKLTGGSNSGILYLVLSFFGLGIINYCLIRDNINKQL